MLSFADFSMIKFLSDSGLSTLDNYAVSRLMDYLGVSEYLLLHQCDMTRPPYNSAVNGWVNGMFFTEICLQYTVNHIHPIDQTSCMLFSIKI
jgi:hypothetical protein